MPQNPFLALIAVLTGSTTPKPLAVDSSGALITVSKAGGAAVTVADGADVAQGTTTDVAWVSGAGTVVSLLKAIAAKVITSVLVKNAGLKYYTVAASQTASALGTGAIGDVLNSVTYVPATTAAGIVQIKDGGGTAITIFIGGGTTALVDLRPQTVVLNAVSAAGGWQITTGANVSVIAVGQFTA